MISLHRAVLGLAVVATGCVTVGSYAPYVTETPLNPPPRHLMQRSADYVEVYSSSPPTQPHVDMALLEVEQNGAAGNADLLRALRERAGAMGCDAVFVNSMRGRFTGGAPFDPSSKLLNATCMVYTNVVYTQPDVAVPPPPSLAPAPLPEGGRRICRDRQDFEANRDCVLSRG